MKPQSTHSVSGHMAKLSDILVIDRLREDNAETKAYIEGELIPSIAEVGLIQPIVLAKLETPISGQNIYGEDTLSSLRLVAGWSRLTAFMYLKHTEIPYVFREELSVADLHVIEVEENIRRKAMSWQSQCIGIYKVHNARELKAAKRHERWGQRATGALLNINVATVNQSLIIAQQLLAGDKEIIEATNLEAAKSINIKRRQLQVEALLAKKSIIQVDIAPVANQVKLPKTSLLSLIPADQQKHQTSPDSHQQEIRLVPSATIPLSSQIFNRPCIFPDNHDGTPSTSRGWMDEQPSESFDFIFTDIPFGIDTDNMKLADVSEIEEEHDVEENILQFRPFLSESYRLLKDKSYLIFFYDICHHEKLLALADQIGFFCQPWPLIWLKTSQVQNRAAHCQWPKSCEYIMVLRKGRATLREAQRRNYIEASSDAERKKYGHPFAKPFEVCKWALAPIVVPGMKGLDPYAGTGSMLSVMLSMGCVPYGCEKKESHFNRLTENMKESYRRILGKQPATFV